MFTKTFWMQTLERAVKSFAQSCLLAIGASQGFNLFTFDFTRVLGFGFGGLVLSVLTSLASVRFGEKDSPSLVRTSAAAKEPART